MFLLTSTEGNGSSADSNLRPSFKDGLDNQTAFVGNYVEWSAGGAISAKYYYAGGQRIAMRDNGICAG